MEKFDAFGSKAEFTYTSSGGDVGTTVKTKFGSSFTLIYYVLFFACFLAKTKALFAGHDNAQIQVTTAFLDDSTPIDLAELGYMFAHNALDPKLGMTAGHMRNTNFNPYHTNVRERTERKEDGARILRADEGFVCPDTTSLLIQGGYKSANFTYVQISFMGCDQS